MAKKDLSKKKFFTTGQIAKICGVSIATVQKWIDAGEIDSYRLPLTGSERRVPRKSLLTFMKKYNVPTTELEAATPYRILVVDSDMSMRKHIQQAWDAADEIPEIRFAESGSDALLQAGGFDPDMILMDPKSPEIEGIKLVELLKSHESFNKTKIVILSDIDEDDKSEMDKFGAETVISKQSKPMKIKKAILKASGLE